MRKLPRQGKKRGKKLPRQKKKLPRLGKKRGKKLPRLKKKLPRKKTVKITSVQKLILDYIQQNPKSSRTEITAKLGSITEDGVKYNLKVLQQKGLLRRVGPDFGGHWEVISD